MKSITSKVVQGIQRRMTPYCWFEGVSGTMADLLKYRLRLKPKYYWKEAKSYIFHIHGTKNWYCITKDYFESI